MKRRFLGSQGLEVPAIGLGCMGMTIQYGELDDVESVEAIHHALDNGLNLLNTADAYGNGKNEILINTAIKNRRSEVILNTKFGQVTNPDRKGGVNGSPSYVREACEASLNRLGTDYIDIFSQHRVDPDIPIEETVGEMGRLIEEGKVRYIGLSEASSETIQRGHREVPITCVETEYSLWTRDVEENILPTCGELGISLMPYAPIGRGFLSGEIKNIDNLNENDRRRDHPRFSPNNIAENYKKVHALERFSFSLGFKPAQVAIAWVLSQSDTIVPIPGTKRRKFIDQNIRATDINLSDKEISDLNKIFPVGETSGDRYPSAQMPKLGL
ncbi:MAG: aldo/keto reductase [Rhodospirillaceae bacterium]|nr:aldo/keto reductase [Rhodospirillaceae bacterium]OUT79909.1 MAG: aldo/keto reductase [Rhodospirillaceae bacterium TMED23]|tara:strand:- start:9217 stop:10200 length:984 start_codon:yes stop_codon:yes gene_type:complete